MLSIGNDKEIQMGIGLANPDTMIDGFYFYASAYRDHKTTGIVNFTSLLKGKWISNDFQGAVLKAPDSDLKTTSAFFKEVMQAFINR